MEEPDWQRLAADFDAPALNSLRELFLRGGSFCVTAGELHARSRAAVPETQKLLELLADRGHLIRRSSYECGSCGQPLEADQREPQRQTCPYPECSVPYADAQPVETERSYCRDAPAPRDVSWFFVLHGMNTEGTWQEDLSALIWRTYAHAVPVAVYKYGVVRPGAVLRHRQRELVDEVAAKLRSLSQQAKKIESLRDHPDVIAHSFGTWLIAHALLAYADLTIGRLLLLGCVVRPDFDWTLLGDRVGEVLNHCALADGVVPAAEYFIPDSGPAGTHGFDSASPKVANVAAPGFEHSSYFEETTLPRIYGDVWEPFFTRAEDPFRGLAPFRPDSPWKPASRLRRVAGRAAAIGLGVPLYGALPLAVIEGVPYLLERRKRRKEGRGLRPGIALP